MSPALNVLLRQTSRSFYLTLRVLPGSIRPQIGLAYLLARATDTIADTELVPIQRRLAALQELRERILGRSDSPLPMADLAQHQGAPAERCLLEHLPQALAELSTLEAADRHHVQVVLETITSGQELDLRRFGAASGDNVVALPTDEDLHDYTYRVAGSVGEFWTRICRAHLFPNAPLDEKVLLADAVRFGQGLQLVNILRDLPRDLRQGRCYLPASSLKSVGLEPPALLQPANFSTLQPLYRGYLDQAEAHLRAGWSYTNALPRGCVRVRLACAWPILIGMETLRLLRAGNPLDPTTRIKVPRSGVRKILFRSVTAYPSRTAWARLFEKSRTFGV